MRKLFVAPPYCWQPPLHRLRKTRCRPPVNGPKVPGPKYTCYKLKSVFSGLRDARAWLCDGKVFILCQRQ